MSGLHVERHAPQRPAPLAETGRSTPEPRARGLHAAQLRAAEAPGVASLRGYHALLNGGAPAQLAKGDAPRTKRKQSGSVTKPGVRKTRTAPRPRKKRKQPAPTRLGIGTYNINHLGLGSEKREDKLDAIRYLLGENPWLDLLALQEVNDPEVLDQLGDEVEVLSGGPLLRTIGVSGSYATRELYPLLARKGSGWKVTGTQVFHAGADAPEDWDEESEDPLVWRDRTGQGTTEDQLARYIGRPGSDDEGTRSRWYNEQHRALSEAPRRERDAVRRRREKALALSTRRRTQEAEQDERTRPAVIYHLTNDDGRTLSVAVVHTTPSGQEFGRRDVYAQVSNLLAHVNGRIESAKEDGATENWVILGDFYLTPEAETGAMTNRTKRDKRGAFGLLFPDTVRDEMDDAPESEFPNLELAHAITATNWPTKHQRDGKREAMQIADFMIVSGGFRDRAAGVFDAWGGGIWPVDWEHRNLERWMQRSDHAPIGAMLSTAANDRAVTDVRYGAERRAFPQAMRDAADLYSVKEMRNEQKKGNDRSLDVDRQDAFFFLSPEEAQTIPEGTYNQFTHDLPALFQDVRSRLPGVAEPLALERTLGANTSLDAFHAQLTSGQRRKLSLATRRAMWAKHLRKVPPKARAAKTKRIAKK